MAIRDIMAVLLFCFSCCCRQLSFPRFFLLCMYDTRGLHVFDLCHFVLSYFLRLACFDVLFCAMFFVFLLFLVFLHFCCVWQHSPWLLSSVLYSACILTCLCGGAEITAGEERLPKTRMP